MIVLSFNVMVIYFSNFIHPSDLDLRPASALKHLGFLVGFVSLKHDFLVKIVLLGTLQAEEPDGAENYHGASDRSYVYPS